MTLAAQLDHAGVTLTVLPGGRLRFDPSDAVDGALRSTLIAEKASLLEQVPAGCPTCDLPVWQWRAGEWTCAACTAPSVEVAVRVCLDAHGYVVVWSRRLNRMVVWTTTDEIAVPPALAALPRFTEAERARLAADPRVLEVLETVVEAKLVFGGAEVVTEIQGRLFEDQRGRW